MEIRYKRDLNSNYMILTEKDPGEESYEIRMITENRIYGFLPCVDRRHENYTEYYYEITGRQSMELLYERRKLNFRQLKALLRELLRILESAGEYLLNPDHLLLDPETMYLHARSEKLCVCYYPGSQKEIQESFLELAEYLLGKLDKSDTEGIEFGYELYQSALEPNFSLMELLDRHTETEKESQKETVQPAEIMSVQEEMLEKTGSWKNFFKRKGRQTVLEDYVAEDNLLGGKTAIFLKEEAMPETACLQKTKREGVFLRSLSTDYPSFQVNSETFLLGKKKDSVDGCIPATTVSRIHARITFDGAVYYVEDLNSTNGTWADQVQLNPYEPCPLRTGMYLTFASVEYEVEL